MPLAAAAAALSLLHGLVGIGPVTPVCREGVPCSKPAADVRLVFRRAGVVRSTTTDAHGRYAIRLAAGTWTVRASAGMSIAPVRITVGRAASMRRDFRIDTGIR